MGSKGREGEGGENRQAMDEKREEKGGGSERASEGGDQCYFLFFVFSWRAHPVLGREGRKDGRLGEIDEPHAPENQAGKRRSERKGGG